MKTNLIFLILMCSFTYNVFANSADLTLQNKKNVEEKHLIYLKNKLSTYKAIKEPFVKLGSLKSYLFFTVIGLAVFFYSKNTMMYYAKYQNAFVDELVFEEDLSRMIDLKKSIKYFKYMAEKYGFWRNVAKGIIAIPWCAAIVNKCLGWAYGSLQEDIEVTQERLNRLAC